jgi:integrase
MRYRSIELPRSSNAAARICRFRALHQLHRRADAVGPFTSPCSRASARGVSVIAGSCQRAPVSMRLGRSEWRARRCRLLAKRQPRLATRATVPPGKAISDARGSYTNPRRGHDRGSARRRGRRRSPATMPGFHAGHPPRDKGNRHPADPPTVEEIVAVMCAAGDGRHARRLRALMVVRWRAGLRIHEALALNESDLDRRRGALLVRRGKGGRRREVGMDECPWAPAALDRRSP